MPRIWFEGSDVWANPVSNLLNLKEGMRMAYVEAPASFQ